MRLPLAAPQVPFVVRRYVLRAPVGAQIPRFAGSTVRGALGRALRQLVCATRLPTCDGCVLRNACAYGVLHDGYTPPDMHMGTGPHAPPPLWLRDVDTGRALAEGDRFAFSIAAYGPAVRSLPYVDEAVRAAAQGGIGKGRLPMELESAEDETRADLGALVERRVDELRMGLRAGSGRLWVRLATPVAIRLKGPRWEAADRPPPSWPARLIGGAARRRIALERRWLEAPRQDVPRVLTAVADAEGVELVACEVRAEWVERYSSTEGRFVPFRGAVGTLQLGGHGVAAALPWLAMAELLSVGSGTTFGFGRVVVGVV